MEFHLLMQATSIMTLPFSYGQKQNNLIFQKFETQDFMDVYANLMAET